MEGEMSEVTIMQVEQLLYQLPLEEQFTVVERLMQRSRQALSQATQRKKPQDLYGIWRGRFPADFDLDAALDDIRHEWEREWGQRTDQ
jgi:hypothetical protein